MASIRHRLHHLCADEPDPIALGGSENRLASPSAGGRGLCRVQDVGAAPQGRPVGWTGGHGRFPHRFLLQERPLREPAARLVSGRQGNHRDCPNGQRFLLPGQLSSVYSTIIL